MENSFVLFQYAFYLYIAYKQSCIRQNCNVISRRKDAIMFEV